MHKYGLIALDLDGTLLNSNKELSNRNFAALNRAAKMGIEIVPTTGRFYGGMPEVIRNLDFVNYAITVNGAEAVELKTGKVIYRAELPYKQAVEIMELLDTLPVIYDCFMDGAGWMTAVLKEKIDETVEDPHYVKMLHELRRPVPELKEFLLQRQQDVQKVQFFTRDLALRRELLSTLGTRFPGLSVSSSMPQNVEINQENANKGQAVLALAKHLGLSPENTMAFGDGLNDMTMIRATGMGIAMKNGCDTLRRAADYITCENDLDGVAEAIERFCLNG